jgi:hypothetical protein
MASLREPVRCEGSRKGHVCGGNTFKCSNPECGSVGCERAGCDSRQFHPVQKCKDCGHSYERIQQFQVAPVTADEGASSSAPGVRISLPNVELIFGGVLGLVALVVAIVGLMGAFGPRGGLPGAGSQTTPVPQIAASVSTPATIAYTDICQCYREGMALAGTGISVLSSQYRTGFVQCRAVFGPQGGDAWTAGWTAREQNRLVAAGCRSWLRGVGR